MSNQTPVPGMGATKTVGSDSYPYTVHKVSASGKTLWASADEHWVVQPCNPRDVVYEFTNSNETSPGRWETFTLRKNGRWLPKGVDMHSTGALHIGNRSFYQDPSF